MRILRIANGYGKDWKDQGLVLSAQAGHYCKCAYHAAAMPIDEDCHKADATRALGDLIVQIQICCAMLNVNFDDVADEAFVAFADQMRCVINTNKKKE